MSDAFEWRDAPPAEFAVIGDPVAHSVSPRMQTAALRALGLEDRYVAIRVPPEEVASALDCLKTLGYRGINVTVPHKAAVIPWLATVEPFAKEANAVNTIRMEDRSGINTDAEGFLDTVRELGVEPPGPVLLLGAGGSARALALALHRHGYGLAVYNRTRPRAEEMVRDLRLDAAVLDDPDPADAMLIVNTTSSSLAGEPLPIDWARARQRAVAYDLMYGAASEPFLTAARQRGLRAVDGLGLLVAQGARSLEWWLGRPAPRDVMAEAIR
jgi:shikimate dehydrogenase